MPTSDIPRQWDVVVVPFPYSDQLAEKRRPALVISSDAFADRTGLLWVAMITSSKTPWPNDVAIDNPNACGLSVASTVRLAKIATIEADRVIRVAGKLDQADIVADGLRNILS